MTQQVFETTFENNLLTVEINKFAKQANGSVMVRYKDTVILSVAVSSTQHTTLNYFPLMVIYQEKLYSAGKIPGSFTKREGRSTDFEVLNSRLIDRALRPLFDKNIKNEIQIINTVLSNDHNCNNENFALFGSSLALLVSDIPFVEAVSAVSIGKIKGEMVINPNLKQKEMSDFLLTLSGTQDSLNMIEAVAKETTEEELLEVMLLGHEVIKKMCAFQEEIRQQIGKEKIVLDIPKTNAALFQEIDEKYRSAIIAILQENNQQKKQKNVLSQNLQLLKDEIMAEYKQKNFFKTVEEIVVLDLEQQKKYLTEIEAIFDTLLTQEIRKMIIHEKKRTDGREIYEIRTIENQVGLLPRTHGSAVFTRGETQSLAVVTLGSLSEGKTIDDLTEDAKKRFMLHYNFPAFSVGSVGRYMSPSRREIGHGMLAEKALLHVLPSEEEFPYSIRVVSEILESNGSSSQATICSSSMALMDAGVPLKNAVAGIAMGLFYDNQDEYVILSDIQGLEDQKGDMDFKVAGTAKGVTALQMDIKIESIGLDILKTALKKARLGRLHILNKMNDTIAKSRKELSPYVLKIKVINIHTSKIRDVIGTGGKIISQIIENNDNVKIDIEQDGRVFIMHQDLKVVERTSHYILNLVKDIEVGQIFEGAVAKILMDKKTGHSFGAIIQLLPGVEGFLHISKLSDKRVDKVEDVVNIGQMVTVQCININEKGKIDLSLKKKH
ncbi:MAG: Polyribonucleotide nucleotidyltransferase [Candidatus Phytoplasma pruni]